MPNPNGIRLPPLSKAATEASSAEICRRPHGADQELEESCSNDDAIRAPTELLAEVNRHFAVSSLAVINIVIISKFCCASWWLDRRSGKGLFNNYVTLEGEGGYARCDTL